ncbi:hypothetical protein AXG93_3253s1260 [Marchantia polymorpha subsp. ruderalis]|uniref:Uncharacterized protein n=1 Tax=Marchantia polymorpha subsp. ruderalis TaxID=1480154 RepID=A0A176WPL9_MARPO|nr:hypothetical protein AXG93_3253s1260 [Marchantia polymorpha subsp. ruderalis]
MAGAGFTFQLHVAVDIRTVLGTGAGGCDLNCSQRDRSTEANEGRGVSAMESSCTVPRGSIQCRGYKARGGGATPDGRSNVRYSVLGKPLAAAFLSAGREELLRGAIVECRNTNTNTNSTAGVFVSVGAAENKI